jgi:hypothetical protein
MSKAGHQKPSNEKGMQDIEKAYKKPLLIRGALCLRTKPRSLLSAKED